MSAAGELNDESAAVLPDGTRCAQIGVLLPPGPGPTPDLYEVPVPENLRDLFELSKRHRVWRDDCEEFLDRAIHHGQTEAFTRRQVAEWWDLLSVVLDLDWLCDQFADGLGYLPSELARACGLFSYADRLKAAEDNDGIPTDPKPRRLTPIHAHVHRLAHRDGWWCAYCGIELACACDAHFGMPAAVSDHVIPRSRGGSNGDANRVLACVPCNSSKRDMTPDEWGRPLWGWLG